MANGVRRLVSKNRIRKRIEKKAVGRSLENLMTFPCVNILVGRGKLALHGAYFGVASGRLLVRDPDTGRFEPVVDGMTDRLPVMRCTT